MPSAGPEFRRLHQLHQELKKVQDQLVRGPRQIKLRQKRIAEAQAELAEKEAELKDFRAETDKKNLDLKAKEAHIVESRQKLNGAASNREYQIISGRIDADKAAMAVLEDEILEFLDRVDQLQKEVEQCKQAILKSEEDVRAFATAFEEKANGLQQQSVELTASVKEAESVIPTEMVEQYHRLVEKYGPNAMAESSNGVCMNCFVQLTPQSKVLVNSGKLIHCGACGRLLYQGE